VESFDLIADDYDRWYDTPEGKSIFREEVDCLRLVSRGCTGRWLEVGVGTGRFASALGVPEGIDPSPAMLEIAARRGIETKRGSAESMPYPDESFDGVLIVLVLCFLKNPLQALKECRRVLRPGGRLLLGAIPAESPWGKLYTQEGKAGHPVYSQARFRTIEETMEFSKIAGFELEDAAGALFWSPESEGGGHDGAKRGISQDAGFLGLLYKIVD
jgi:ubiquinone/menaquinone biosynthesis C-methylase UbiE